MHTFRRVRRLAGAVKYVLRNRSLPLRTRCDLAFLTVAKQVALPSEFPLHFYPGVLYLARNTLEVDLTVFNDIMCREVYRTDYVGATVIDVGSHRGYYGAYAFSRGAQAVLSFEPEARNFASLARTARTFRRRGRDWRAYNVAVSSSGGEATLYTTVDSWSHSLLDGGIPVEGRQKVQLRAISEIITEAQALGRRLIVKLNAEGSECDIVLGTAVDAWRQVSELFVEIHAFAPCGQEELVAHLNMAGLGVRRMSDESPHVLLALVSDRVGAETSSGSSR